MYDKCHGADCSRMLTKGVSNDPYNFSISYKYINILILIAGPYLELGRERVKVVDHFQNII